jgi:hypothetical protein
MLSSGAERALLNNRNYYHNILAHFIDYPNPCYHQIELVSAFLWAFYGFYGVGFEEDLS